MTHDVFICHSSQDRIIANAICATLEQHRIRCWIAPRDVLPGMEYAGAIVDAIAGSKLTVLVFSGNSNASPHVRREIERTVSRGIPVLPFRIEDVVPSPALEYFISDAHWLDAMTPPIEQHLEHLVGTVRLLLDRQASAASAASVVASGPAQSPLSPPTPPPMAVQAGAVRTTPAAALLSAGVRPRPAWQWAALGIGGIAAVVLAGVLVIEGLTAPQGAIATSPPPGPGASATLTPTARPTIAPTPTAAGSVVPTDNPADDFFDPFEFDVAEAWAWWGEDPELWTVDEPFGWLTITSPAKPPLANVLLYEPAAPGFGITTLLRFHPTSGDQLAGVVLAGQAPDTDRVQFGWGSCDGDGCAGEGLYLSAIVSGERVRHHVTLIDGSPSQLFIALTILGNGAPSEQRIVYAQYSFDGGDDWFDAGTVPYDVRFTRIGLIVLDARERVSASFEYAYVARYLE